MHNSEDSNPFINFHQWCTGIYHNGYNWCRITSFWTHMHRSGWKIVWGDGPSCSISHVLTMASSSADTSMHDPSYGSKKVWECIKNGQSKRWEMTWWHDWWRMSGFRRIPAGWGSWWHDLFSFHLSMLHPSRLDGHTMSFAARVRKSLLLSNRIFRKPLNWSHCRVGQPCMIMKVHAKN